jgi:IS5 family transposase
MKVEVAVDATGIPVGVATDAANVPETDLGGVALASIPRAVAVPDGTPVVADKGYDSDPLRDDLAAAGFTLVAPHRKNRVKPRTADGRRLRRSRRRYIVERTLSWYHSYRRAVTRYERKVHLFDGFVFLALAFIGLNRLL